MMNKLPFTGFAFMAVMFLASCGGGDVESSISDSKSEVEEAASEEVATEVEEAEVATEVVVADRSNNSECDEFLDGYEKFMDNYIVILKKQQADPTDFSIIAEVASIMTEASEWTSKTPDCTDLAFVARLGKIQMKMAAAASGM